MLRKRIVEVDVVDEVSLGYFDLRLSFHEGREPLIWLLLFWVRLRLLYGCCLGHYWLGDWFCCEGVYKELITEVIIVLELVHIINAIIWYDGVNRGIIIKHATYADHLLQLKFILREYIINLHPLLPPLLDLPPPLLLDPPSLEPLSDPPLRLP